MTRPNTPETHASHRGVTNQSRSRWLVPLVPPALGGVILVAAATNEHLLSGLIGFAALAAVGVVSAITGPVKAARRGLSPTEGEREAIINSRAMSAVGTVLVIALTGCVVFTLTRGQSTTPYTALLAIGGTSYAVALLALRNAIP